MRQIAVMECVGNRAERPPVTVRRDTIEFNASGFKTIPNGVGGRPAEKKLAGCAG